MSQNTKNVEPEYKDEGQILKPSTTEHPLYGKIVDACKTVYDPEIPVNIVDLGLVYNCEIKEQEGGVNILIQMTLTAPGCGMGPVIADEVKQKLLSLSGAKAVEVELVWEPQWNQDMMSDAAKLQLGLY